MTLFFAQMPGQVRNRGDHRAATRGHKRFSRKSAGEDAGNLEAEWLCCEGVIGRIANGDRSRGVRNSKLAQGLLQEIRVRFAFRSIVAALDNIGEPQNLQFFVVGLKLMRRAGRGDREPIASFLKRRE